MRMLLGLVIVSLLVVPAHAEDRPTNRLAGERSPYLRQHQHNPVDWYPWGPEAHAKAKRENRPIFLSIGYAACHWCHVMEHESFEDVSTARILNKAFVCVKVDREERPDLDELYMTAVRVMGDPGGWPTTIVLTPDGLPFWGGTYLRRGDLQSLAQKLARQWQRDPKGTRAKAQQVARGVAKMTQGPRMRPVRGSDADLITHVRSALRRNHDARNGGRIASKKFPPHAELFLFTDRKGAFATEADLRRVRRTLDAMDEGGFHDQVGGGFHRYTVDSVWFLPHFEKMLYDNAWLLRAYAGMYAIQGKPRDRRAALRCLAWMERELKQATGGYASSLDADTQGHEGLTYTWTIEEMRRVLTPRQARWVPDLLSAQRGGNFERRNVLHLKQPLANAARTWRLTPEVLHTRFDNALERLRVARDRRAQPRLDEKVIVAWNGMLLGAMARAGADLNHPPALESARALASYLLTACRDGEGHLFRFPMGSGAPIRGYCEDHVHLIEGLLELGEVTGERPWIDEAHALGLQLVNHFHDKARGGFWANQLKEHDTLFARVMDGTDGPIPSDNGMAVRACLRLHAATGDPVFSRAAASTLQRWRHVIAGSAAAQSANLAHALALRGVLESRRLPTSAAKPLVSVRQDVARVSVYETSRAPGHTTLRVHVALDPGWHVPANRPGAGTWVATTLTSQATSLEVSYPEGTGRDVSYQAEPVFQYAGAFDITARLTASDVATPLLLVLQPCDEQGTCKEPMTVTLQLPPR